MTAATAIPGNTTDTFLNCAGFPSASLAFSIGKAEACPT